MDPVTGSLATLEHVAQEARVFPDGLLREGEEGLSLFSAAFLGANDAIQFALAGMTATCVDTDAIRLGEMRDLYPDDWEFVCADAFAFAEEQERTWDVVCVDPFSNYFDVIAERVALWCSLARRVVLLGAGVRSKRRVVAPEGWEITQTFRRSSHLAGVYWVVLERA